MKFSSRFGALLALGIVSKVSALNKLISCNSVSTLSEENCGVAYCIYDTNFTTTPIPGGLPTSFDKGIYETNLQNGVCIPQNNPPTIANTSITSGKVNFFFESNYGILTTSGTVDSAYICTLASGTISDCLSFDESTDINPNRYYLNAAADSLTAALGNYSSSNVSPIDGKSGAFYPSSNGVGLISCDSEKCEVYKSNFTGNSYYLSTLVGYVIKCTPSSGCDNLPVTSEAYFHNAAFSSTSTNQLIYCNGSQCEGLSTTAGNYVDEDTKKLIECVAGTCKTNTSVNNFYISPNPNILIDCTSSSCENVQAKIGIYILGQEGNQFIKCDSSSCNQLSPTESEKIPICEESSKKCAVKTSNGGNSETQVLLPEGAYCRNELGTILYFATNTIELEDSIVVTTSSNCIQANSAYFQFYYTVGPTIYHIDDGEVTQITAPGYYFINTSSNKLVTGTKIEDYNNSYVKLYKCNGVSCVVIPNPSTTTYYVDVNKKIFKYSGNTFSFAYDKDVICRYANNKCSPQTDLKSMEFCVTASGELVIAANDIEAKKEGDCYKASSISNEIFGYSSNLYKLNLFDATLIDNTGYFLVSMNTNSTTEFKEFSNKNSDIVLYGCSLSSCAVRSPETGVYYYDNVSHYLVRYDAAASQWVYPTADGYALISTEPGEQYVRKFTVDSTNKVTITEKVSDGYYYTTDNEMYECPNTEGSSCELIDESMYVMTNDNELYYCNVDDDDLTSTVCNKQSCVLGELYYIGGYHFRCVTGNIFNILSTKYCNNDEFVVVNFPTAFSETYPSNVKNAVDEISKNNNNTATVKAGSNHLTVIPGIFTNCTYDKEEKMASFDLVCIENYVVLDSEKEPQICSTSKLGFVGCNEDSENPDKCNPSSAMTIFLSKVAIAFAMVFLGFMLY